MPAEKNATEQPGTRIPPHGSKEALGYLRWCVASPGTPCPAMTGKVNKWQTLEKIMTIMMLGINKEGESLQFGLFPETLAVQARLAVVNVPLYAARVELQEYSLAEEYY